MSTEKKISPNMSLEKWLNYWFDTYAFRAVKQSTAVSYKGYIKNHFVPHIGKIKLSKLNCDILQKFYNRQLDEGSCGTRKGGLSAKTIRNMNIMLHKSLKKAMDLELINKNFAEMVELPKVKQPEMTVLTIEQQRKLMSELKVTDEKLGIATYISLATGLRIGEVCGLKWSDIDFQNNTIKVNRTLNRLMKLDDFGNSGTEIVVGDPKSDKSLRTIPFNDRFADTLKDYRKKSAEWLEKKPTDDDYLVSLKYGSPVEPKTVYTIFKRIAANAGIVDCTFHSLRHTFATRAIEKNVDVKTLSVLLGHADVGTTLNRYAHVLDDQKRKTMDILLEDF